MSNFPNQGTVYLEGNPVKMVSLLTGNATPQNSPKVIAGELREQIILCDPLTGLPLDLEGGGGGGGSFATLTGQPSDNANLSVALNNKVSFAANWAADTNVVTGVTGLTSLTNSAPGAQTSFRNTKTGTTAVAYLGGGITSVDFNDEVLWNPLIIAWELLPFKATAAQMPAFTGDVTTAAGVVVTTLQSTAPALNTQSTNAQVGTTYTLALADAGQNVDMNNASPNTLTIPLNAAVAFPVNTVISVTMSGAGVTTIAFAGTVQKPSARTLAISAQYESAVLTKMATDTWRILVG